MPAFRDRVICWAMLVPGLLGVGTMPLPALQVLPRPGVTQPTDISLTAPCVAVVVPIAVFAWAQMNSGNRRPVPLRRSGSGDGGFLGLTVTAVVCGTRTLGSVLADSVSVYVPVALVLPAAVTAFVRRRQLTRAAPLAEGLSAVTRGRSFIAEARKTARPHTKIGAAGQVRSGPGRS